MPISDRFVVPWRRRSNAMPSTGTPDAKRASRKYLSAASRNAAAPIESRQHVHGDRHQLEAGSQHQVSLPPSHHPRVAKRRMCMAGERLLALELMSIAVYVLAD